MTAHLIALDEYLRQALNRNPVAMIVVNEAIPRGLIVNELVSNALKHGFPNDQSGTVQVQVQISQTADQVVEPSISNDGQGIAPGLNLTKFDFLGLQLVHLLTRQLHGRLDVRRSNPTRFTLTFRMGENT